MNKDKRNNWILGPYGTKIPAKYAKAMTMAIICAAVGATIATVLGKVLGFKSTQIKYFVYAFILLGTVIGFLKGVKRRDQENPSEK